MSFVSDFIYTLAVVDMILSVQSRHLKIFQKCPISWTSSRVITLKRQISYVLRDGYGIFLHLSIKTIWSFASRYSVSGSTILSSLMALSLSQAYTDLNL